MQNLVTFEKGEPVVDLSTIVMFSENTEDAVQSLIRKYEREIEELTNEEDPISNPTLPRNKATGQIVWSKVKLNEEQTYFLLTLLKNTENVIRFKHTLIKQFFKMRQELLHIREQTLIETFEEEKKLAIEEARKLKTYDGYISVRKYVTEINQEITKDEVWDALEYAGYAKHILKTTKYRRLADDCDELIGKNLSGPDSSPVFTEAAINYALKQYYKYIDQQESGENQND